MNKIHANGSYRPCRCPRPVGVRRPGRLGADPLPLQRCRSRPAVGGALVPAQTDGVEAVLGLFYRRPVLR